MPPPFTPSGPEELLSREELAAMTGLEFLQGIVEGRLPAAPIAKTLDMALIEAVEGRVTFSGQPGFHHYNPIGGVHGGWFGTLLDSCMACAVQTRLPKGVSYTTLEYKINIVRGVTEKTGPVHGIGEATHVGRRTGTAEGRVVGAEDGKLYAFGTTTCLILPIET